MYIHQRGFDSSQERGVEDDPAPNQVSNSLFQRDQRALAAFELDFEQVAGAVILDRDDGANYPAILVLGAQSDQIGVIIFAFLERREGRAVDLDQRSAQRLGG